VEGIAVMPPNGPIGSLGPGATAVMATQPLAIIVDDEPAIRNIVGTIAQEAGFDTLMAESGSALLNILGEGHADEKAPHHPAVILLDLQMPGTDGVQVMTALASRALSSRIVLLSGTDMRVIELARENARQRGLTVAAVVQKPFRRTELLEILDRIAAENETFSAKTLASCLETGAVTLHYQPKISLANNDVTAVEALLRCKDSAGRMVPPENVVAIAEQAGMIDSLSEYIFRQAVHQRRLWSEAGFKLGIAVNFSARCSFDANLPDILAGICASEGTPTDAITLELTEGAVMNDRVLAAETLLRLRLKGFKLSIDDFGVGYSSLVRLKQLPFTEVKVDKSFVTGLHQSRDSAAIVRAIVQLAHALDMQTVAEGIEDAEALDFIASLGCDAAQGYYIARPMPAADFSEFSLTWKWRRASMSRGAEEAGPEGSQTAGTASVSA
jgi:EAL domain-containing protein (putative c-di-GMP-specific phosphodiesterase class I)/ActR/RegA family two-component response regulator